MRDLRGLVGIRKRRAGSAAVPPGFRQGGFQPLDPNSGALQRFGPDFELRRCGPGNLSSLLGAGPLDGQGSFGLGLDVPLASFCFGPSALGRSKGRPQPLHLGLQVRGLDLEGPPALPRLLGSGLALPQPQFGPGQALPQISSLPVRPKPGGAGSLQVGLQGLDPPVQPGCLLQGLRQRGLHLLQL